MLKKASISKYSKESNLYSDSSDSDSSDTDSSDDTDSSSDSDSDSGEDYEFLEKLHKGNLNINGKTDIVDRLINRVFKDIKSNDIQVGNEIIFLFNLRNIYDKNFLNYINQKINENKSKFTTEQYNHLKHLINLKSNKTNNWITGVKKR